jgi:outer membrane receptor protein involved in Fe transport
MVRVFSFIFLILVDLPSYAQQDSIAQLNEIVISVNRDAASMRDLPYAVNRLDQKKLQQNLSRTLPEALSGTAGLFIQKTNHGGGSPFIRGLTGNQALMLVDGIRLNNSIFRYGPNQYLTLVDPYNVERIEVLKGTGSVQYGSDAMTGVINVITPDLSFSNSPNWSAKILQRVTSDRMEFTTRPQLIFSDKRIAFSVAAGYKNFGDLKGGDTTGFQRPSGYSEQNIDLQFKADLGKNWIMKLVYQDLKQIDVPVYHKYVLENFSRNSSDPLQRSMGYIKFEKRFDKGALKKIDHFISYQNIAENRYSIKKNSSLLRKESDRAATTGMGSILHFQFNGWWNMNAGWEWYADRIRSARQDRNEMNGLEFSLRGLYPDDATYTNKAVYILNQIRLGKLSIDAGTRYNAYTARIFDSSLGRIQLDPSALVFQAGVNYRLTNDLTVFANLTEGFRAPNIDDLGTLGIVDFRYELPAYDLKPERSLNKELGIRYHTKILNTSFSLFQTDLKGLITRVKTGATSSGYDVYKKLNVDKGFIRGWEMQIDLKPCRNVLLSGMASYLYGQSLSRDQPLRRIPPFNTRMSFQYNYVSGTMGIVYDHADPQRRLEAGDKADNRIPVGGTPGFNIVNAFVSRELKNITMSLYLSNIFNADYRTHGSGINGMGRALSFSVLWNPKFSKQNSK